MCAAANTRTFGNERAVDDRPPLSCAVLTKRFGSVVALDQCTLDIRPGEVLGLVGHNGSGKSTLLRLAAGLLRPTSGSVAIAGYPAGSRAARRLVAFVPDEPAGLEELTIAEHVSLVAALAGRDGRAGRDAASHLGLDDRLDQSVGALSRGLRRRAAVAAACAAEPALLMLDEVTAPLDAEARLDVATLLRGLAATGTAAVVTTHDHDFVRTVCDRVVLLRAGRIVGAGPGTVATSLLALAGLQTHAEPATADVT